MVEVSQIDGVRERVMADKECPFADMQDLRRVSGWVYVQPLSRICMHYNNYVEDKCDST